MEARARLIGVDELRSHLGRELERLRKEAHPLYVTRRGKPAGVLMDTAAYEELIDRIEYLEDSIAAMEGRELPDEEFVDLDDVIIPKRLRDRLGLQGGEELEVEELHGRIEMRRRRRDARLVETKDHLLTMESGPGLGPDEVRELLERTRR